MIVPLLRQALSVVSLHWAPASTASWGTMLIRMEPVVGTLLKFAVILFGPVILMDAGLLLPLRSPLQFEKA